MTIRFSSLFFSLFASLFSSLFSLLFSSLSLSLSEIYPASHAGQPIQETDVEGTDHYALERQRRQSERHPTQRHGRKANMCDDIFPLRRTGDEGNHRRCSNVLPQSRDHQEQRSRAECDRDK